MHALENASFSKMLLQKEELEQKHLHLVQIVESEKTAKWQYTQQCEELTMEIKKLRAEVSVMDDVVDAGSGSVFVALQSHSCLSFPSDSFSDRCLSECLLCLLCCLFSLSLQILSLFLSPSHGLCHPATHTLNELY